MPGRKNPEPNESEKTREYLRHNLRERGENLQGDLGAELDGRGAHGEIKARREGHDIEREP